MINNTLAQLEMRSKSRTTTLRELNLLWPLQFEASMTLYSQKNDITERCWWFTDLDQSQQKGQPVG